jgi:hypothetical protein
MQVSFDAAAPRGQQFTITKPDGTMLAGVAQATALASLMSQGSSIREAAIIVAEAKLRTSTAA